MIAKMKNFNYKQDAKKFVSTFLPYLSLIAVIVIFQILSNGRLLSQRNVNAIINSCFQIMLMSAGVIFVMAQGELDLSVGGIMTIAAVCAAYSSRLSIYLALPVALACGLLIGFINGVVVGKLKVNGFIATLAMQLILFALAIVLLNSSGIGVPKELKAWNSQPLRIVVMVILTTIGGIVFGYTKYGKECRAIGSNSVAAFYQSIDVGKKKMQAYMISGLMAGILAFMSLMRSGSATPTLGQSLEFNTLIALLIGGFPITGGFGARYRAVVLGSITMTFLSLGMNMAAVAATTQQLIRGLIFLGIVGITFERDTAAIIK